MTNRHSYSLKPTISAIWFTMIASDQAPLIPSGCSLLAKTKHLTREKGIFHEEDCDKLFICIQESRPCSVRSQNKTKQKTKIVEVAEASEVMSTKTVEVAEAKEVMSIVVDINKVSDMVTQDANLSESGSSSTYTQDENIYEKLKKAAQDGDIERLYELIAEDPSILGHFDKMPFCETPLHIAAEKGKAHFAMELMTLKPSLASKLNVLGFSPIHLALQNNHIRMVRGFVAIDNNLVRIKGRGRITPLHHVARTGDAELLSEFLFACPSSVNDLTIKCETVVHIAVKNHQLMAIKVLLGWVKRVNREEILNWKNEDGNTVFHIAASINQVEVMKLMRKSVKVKAKNLDGKTAMDILQTHQSTHQSPCFPEARRFLHSAKERLLCGSTTTLAEYLSKNLSFIEKRNTILGLSNLTMTRDMSVNTSNRRDGILVVAILIVTSTYQVGLSPPGGFWQEDSPTHSAGEMTMSFNDALYFLSLNGFAFLSSLYVIIILIIGLPMWKLIYGSTAILSIAMLASYRTILPTRGVPNWYVKEFDFAFAYPLLIVTMLFATFMTVIVHKRSQHRVDFPASCFSSSGITYHRYPLLHVVVFLSVVFFLISRWLSFW